MTVSRSFQFSTVVWGPWHTGVFLDANLPSLLASGNLQAFASRHQVTYRIQTAEDDVARITSSTAYQQASRIVNCQVIGHALPRGISPIAMHHIFWRQGIEDARKAGAMVLLVPPDVIWSNGSLGHVADIAAQGKTAIFMTYMRVVSETAVPAIILRFRNAHTGVIDASSRQMVDVAMRHIHPLTLTYRRDSTNFPTHPEFLLWPVEGEGFLMRVLVREMFAYDPRQYDLNEQALLAHAPDPDQVHYITDSDDLFALSLAPLTKDMEWYATPRRLDPLTVAAWWLRYDSPGNDLVARHHFSIHAGARTPDTWRRAQSRSDILMQRISGTREVLRVMGAMASRNLTHGEQLLATALSETKLAHFIRPADAPATILLPGAGDVYRAISDTCADTCGAGGRALLALVLGHTLLGRLEMVPGKNQDLTTALGHSRQLTWRGGTALIDGVEVRPRGFSLGQYLCHEVSALLPPVQGRRRQGESHARVASQTRA